MTILFAAMLAHSTADELRDVRRLLHRAGRVKHRLGVPWSGRVLDDDYPAILAAVCLSLCDELGRREGSPLGRCAACLATLGLSGDGPAATEAIASSLAGSTPERR